jgi:hypothetical protein
MFSNFNINLKIQNENIFHLSIIFPLIKKKNYCKRLKKKKNKMNLPNDRIIFLRDVPSDIKVDMTSGWRTYYFDGSINDLSFFIKSIRDDKIYLVIPLFSNSTSLKNATLNLSEPFFVNNESNSALIIKFILDQWYSSGFSLNPGTLITFSIKFKRVWLSYK